MITKVKINLQTILNLDIEQLDELVLGKGYQLYHETFGEKFSDNDQGKIFKAILSTKLLDAEVRNGGFDQFFFNKMDLTESALFGLQLIKADKQSLILNEAFKIFNNQKEEFPDERNPNLDLCDEQYYELGYIDDLRQKYLSDNIEKFFD